MAKTKKEVKKTSAKPNRTNAIIAWLIAPITSLIFMNDKDEFTKKCAKHSLYFGVADVVLQTILLVGGFVLSFAFIGVCCFPISVVLGLVSLGIRIMGAVKANEGEVFKVPVISDMVKE